MRQRTLGIIAGVLLAGGAALGIGTGIVAYRTAATSPSANAAERVPARQQRPGPGNLEPGFRQPSSRPGRQRGPGAPP
jgi:hypothetical protein